MSWIFIILLVIELSFFFFYTKDIFHPASIFLSIWFVSCAISCVDYSDFMSKWSKEMYFVVLLSSISFWIGSCFFLKLKATRALAIKGKDYNFNLILITRLLFIISLLCFLLEWVHGGMYVFSLSDVGSSDLKSEVGGGIPGVHYGTLFLPFVAVLSFFNIQNSKKNSLWDLGIILIVIAISLFFKISRGDLILYILSFLFIYSRYNVIKSRVIFVASSILIIMFSGIMLLRVNAESVIMNTTSNPLFSIFYTYIATCYANLNDLILSDFDYHLCGNATFSPLWSLLGIKDNFAIINIDQLEVFNARTYLYGFYHDYKIFGIVFFPFLLGLSLSYIYNLTLKRTYWIILLAMLQKAIFTPFFGNYFFGELVILFPYIFTVFIIVISYFPLKRSNL